MKSGRSTLSRQPSKGTLAFSLSRDDFDWEYFRAGGNGGQNQNKRDTGVRVWHRPSGAVGESREERSQLQNRKAALGRLIETPKFKAWVSTRLSSGPTPEERVAEDMKPENLKVEGRVDGKWEALVL